MFPTDLSSVTPYPPFLTPESPDSHCPRKRETISLESGRVVRVSRNQHDKNSSIMDSTIESIELHGIVL